MTAATMAQTPLSREGFTFWEDLIAECKRYAATINAEVSSKGLAADQFLRCDSNSELHIQKAAPPSASIRLTIDFFSWGPVIRGQVTGRETDAANLYREEWEVPIAKDLDGAVIGIFGEGRSFSPHDLARYLVQTLRRCYPGVTLPCECRPAG